MTEELGFPFFQAGEQLIRMHRFRFVTAQGCALGSVEIDVEEALAGTAPGGARCLARPFHPQRVARPDYTFRGDSVEAAVRALIERLRARPLTDAFLPSH